MLETIYGLLDMALPVQWLDHNFMKNAFLAILLVTPLFGLLGTMVVNNKMAFFSDSLGHGAFTGIALGMLLGGVRPMIALVVFSICFAMLITYIKNKSSASADTIIGVFSSTAIAIGLMLMSYGKSFGKFSSYLIGDLLSIAPDELAALAIVFVLVVAAWIFIFNRLLIVGVNPSFAASRGMRALGVEMIFASILAVVVAVSIQWVGLLIINSLLVLPAAAARNVSNNVKQYHFYSISFAVIAGILGLIFSYYCDTATGATVVLFAAMIFFITLPVKRRMTR